MNTHIPKIEEIKKNWFIIDANGQVLGRLATKAASILMGKDKVIFTPHMDTGDEVIVINAAKVRTTGNKAEDKVYSRYSAYPGGLHQTKLATMLKKQPEYVIRHAVKGMLPKSKLGDRLLKKLRVYAGEAHEQTAQAPKVVVLGKGKSKE